MYLLYCILRTNIFVQGKSSQHPFSPLPLQCLSTTITFGNSPELIFINYQVWWVCQAHCLCKSKSIIYLALLYWPVTTSFQGPLPQVRTASPAKWTALSIRSSSSQPLPLWEWHNHFLHSLHPRWADISEKWVLFTWKWLLIWLILWFYNLAIL